MHDPAFIAAAPLLSTRHISPQVTPRKRCATPSTAGTDAPSAHSHSSSRRPAASSSSPSPNPSISASTSASTSRPPRRPRHPPQPHQKPRVESLIRGTQAGFAAADDFSAFLRAASRAPDGAAPPRARGGSGRKSREDARAAPGAKVDCYVMPPGREVTMHPGA